MGTWGIGILDDDEVSDVVGAFFHAYDGGASPAEASAVVRRRHRPASPPRAEDVRTWLGLAHAEWECKALAPDTLGAVRAIVESDLDAQRGWGRQAAARRRALKAFLAQIEVAPARPRRRKPPTLVTPPFATGSCLVFRCGAGSWGSAVVLATSGDDRPLESASTLIALTSAEGRRKPTLDAIANATVTPLGMVMPIWSAKLKKREAGALEAIEVVGRLDVTTAFPSTYGTPGTFAGVFDRSRVARAQADDVGPRVPVAELVRGPTDPDDRALLAHFTAGAWSPSADPQTRHDAALRSLAAYVEKLLAMGAVRRGDPIDVALARPEWRAVRARLQRAIVSHEVPPLDHLTKPVWRWHHGHLKGLIAPP